MTLRRFRSNWTGDVASARVVIGLKPSGTFYSGLARDRGSIALSNQLIPVLYFSVFASGWWLTALEQDATNYCVPGVCVRDWEFQLKNRETERWSFPLGIDSPSGFHCNSPVSADRRHLRSAEVARSESP
jgi:hypothetical protein